ncbi:MAG: DUF6272 family protein [Candidatus Absconditabacteria bacterium]|nr:DUF6272 family protein [Candidatus Absconditabacteria bacterium]
MIIKEKTKATEKDLKNQTTKDMIYIKGQEEGRKAIISIFGDINSIENQNNKLIYHKKNINNKNINNIGEIIQTTNDYLKSIGLTNYKKDIESVIITIYKNTIRHSIKELQSNISIYEKKEENQNFICVETINYIKKEEQKNYLEKLLNDINQKEKEEIHDAFIKQITDRELGDPTKGVGLLKIGKKIKNENNPKPFKFQFKKTEINGESIRLAKITCKIAISKTIIDNNQSKKTKEILSENN